MASISDKIKALRAETGKHSSNPENVCVVAVTKNVGMEMVNEAISAGITDIGENRVREAKLKFHGMMPCTRHFIGHLQRNKVKEAVQIFDSIDSVDSYVLAELINVEAERALKKMRVLVQVNIANDKAKFGIPPEETGHFLRKVSAFKCLEIEGLMAIIPFFDDPEDGRKHFGAMKSLIDGLKPVYPSFKRLSMGMSNDFRIALEEGSNEIRIGSYLFK